MAAKKAKSGPAGRKAASPAVADQRVIRQPPAVSSASGNPNRLLREAAWSQMFGRIESKNPFSR